MIDHSDRLADPARMDALSAYDMDHPQLRSRLDDLARRTADQLELPTSLITLVLDSAQVIIGSAGLEGSWIAEAGGTPVEWSFCASAVVSNAPYIVVDAPHDPVHHDNPLVTEDGISAYAGVPLVSPQGHVLGAACVLSDRPHTFTPEHVEGLQAASVEAMAVLESFRLDR